MGRGQQRQWLPNMTAGASFSSPSRNGSTWSFDVQDLLLNMDPPIWPMWSMQPMSPHSGLSHSAGSELAGHTLAQNPFLAPAIVATIITLPTGARTKSCRKPQASHQFHY